MLEIGQYNDLRVIKIHEIGAFLDGDKYGEILLPAKYVPPGTAPGEVLHVFIYRDSDDLVIATTQEPKAVVGDVAWLECRMVTDVGAFMDWGLLKDLLVPFREQPRPMVAGQSYWVKVYFDKPSQRIVATAKSIKFANNEHLTVALDDEVELAIIDETDMGYKVIVNGLHWGLLYKNEVFSKPSIGARLRGYVKKIREDNKLDVSLQKQGYTAIPELSQRLLHALNEHHGFLPVNDHSPPEEVYKLLQMSKKTFKKAAGFLYKNRMISMDEKGIKLV